MKVYIDLVFFINFFFDFIIIYGTKYILKLHTKLYRIIMGSFIGSLSILLLFISLNNISLFILK
ncbi:MAG: sigma-E processing peptidase SpoIIGA [Bacilli bacterium]|nr:sigma-E processing peptidase SpoIIGA [Bacilli bacterium]